MKQKRACADACNKVTPMERPSADDIKYTCFGEIEKRIAVSNQIRAQNATAADGAARSGNAAGSQEAENLQGSNDVNRPCTEGEACGQRNPAVQNVDTNLGTVSQLLRTGHDCRYSGASTIICSKGGMVYTIPSGPGQAFQPYTGH